MNKGRFPKLWSVVFRSFYCSRIPPFHRLYPSLTKIFNLSWKSAAFKRPMLAVVPTVFALKFLQSKESEQKANAAAIIKRADELYDKGKYGELYELLYAQEETDNPEILWRLARATYETSRKIAKTNDKLKNLERALSYVEKALEINDSCAAGHKWKAILLDAVWSYKSTKGRLVQSFEIRKHMERAIELNPKDATSYYTLGKWCYTFADLPWYQRKAAALIFVSPPTSTFEEAYSYFEKAEEVDPGFYTMNWLMLARCLVKLKETEKAIEYLHRVHSYRVKTPDDREAREEARMMMRKLGVM